MKAAWALAAGILMAVGAAALLAAPARAGEPQPLTTPRDKVNYSIGVNLISNLKQQGIEVDLDLIMRGMKDALSGGRYLLSDEEIRIAVQRYQSDIRQRRSREIAKTAAANQKEGADFLAKNKTAEGVVTLPSGLQYKILKAGAGPKPTDADTVELRYLGTLLSGVVLERSEPDGGAQTVFKVDQTLPGWREALKLMPVGSKWQLFIPPALAHGSRGRPGTIGQNVTVFYDLELVAIRPASK